MEFTGERYVPGVSGAIALEHLQRYVLARELAPGRRVLDIACGEGYGSALLAPSAVTVVGVDIDEASVRHAAGAYAPLANVTFVVGSCDHIPLRSGSIDLVVSFETLEHHDRHHQMLGEIKRVLAPGGLLVLSSPNKPVYDARSMESNPFHVRELDTDELDALLRAYFPQVHLWGQTLATGSLVFPMRDGLGPVTTPVHALALEDGCLRRRAPVLPAPTYVVAVCGDRPLDPLPELASVAIDDDLHPAHLRAVRELKEARQAEASRAEALGRDLDTARQQLADEMSVTAALRAQEAALQAQEATLRAQSAALRAEHARARDESQRALDAQSERARAAETAAGALQVELADVQGELEVMRASRSWRLTAPLRDARGTLARLLQGGLFRRRET